MRKYSGRFVRTRRGFRKRRRSSLYHAKRLKRRRHRR